MGCNIELESITSAIKARDLLRRKNIRVKIEKTSNGTKKGCSHSVITDKDCESALKILNGNVKIIGIS